MIDFEGYLAIVEAYRAQLEDNKVEIASVIAQETGKSQCETATESDAMIGKIGIYVATYNKRTGNSENYTATWFAVLCHKHHGGVAVFGPYNFHGHLLKGYIVPALLAGNTVVLKPS